MQETADAGDRDSFGVLIKAFSPQGTRVSTENTDQMGRECRRREEGTLLRVMMLRNQNTETLSSLDSGMSDISLLFGFHDVDAVPVWFGRFFHEFHSALEQDLRWSIVRVSSQEFAELAGSMAPVLRSVGCQRVFEARE